jgi:hypothetical protein
MKPSKAVEMMTVKEHKELMARSNEWWNKKLISLEVRMREKEIKEINLIDQLPYGIINQAYPIQQMAMKINELVRKLNQLSQEK